MPWTDHLPRGALPSVCDREVSIIGRPWPTRGCRYKKNLSRRDLETGETICNMSLNDVVSLTVHIPFLLSASIQPHMFLREHAVFCDRGCCSKNV